MKALHDETGVVTSWLVKVLLLLAIFGVVVYDIASMTTNYFGLQTAADEIASTLSTLQGSGELVSQTEVEREAKALAREAGAVLVSAEMDYEGVIRIRLRRKASTLFVGNIDPIKHWARATASAEAATD